MSRAADRHYRPGNSFSGSVGALTYPFCPQNTVEVGARCRLIRATMPLEFGIFRRRTNVRAEVKSAAVDKVKRAEFGLADTDCVFQDGLENRLQISR